MKKRILIVSDVHENTEILQQLIDKLSRKAKKEPPFDILLLGGDFLNIKNGEKDAQTLTAEIAEGKKKILSIMRMLRPLAQDVYFVPGNHDILPLFNADDEVSQMLRGEGICNVHKKMVRMHDDLYICGLGGSRTGVDKDGKKRWDGYPYEGDLEALKKDVAYLKKEIKDVVKESGGAKRTVLVLTHNPPGRMVSTGTDYSHLWHLHDSYIAAGSDCLFDMLRELTVKKKEEIDDRSEEDAKGYLKSYRENLNLVNIHGHVHNSQGSVQFRRMFSVINCGGMSKGLYTTLTLRKKSGDEESWGIEKVSHKKL